MAGVSLAEAILSLNANLPWLSSRVSGYKSLFWNVPRPPRGGFQDRWLPHVGWRSTFWWVKGVWVPLQNILSSWLHHPWGAVLGVAQEGNFYSWSSPCPNWPGLTIKHNSWGEFREILWDPIDLMKSPFFLVTISQEAIKKPSRVMDGSLVLVSFCLSSRKETNMLNMATFEIPFDLR